MNTLLLYKERAMKLIKQILFPTLLVALTACTTVASQPETVYISEEVVPEEDFFSQAELDQMLAPVALYPDVLLSQVLMAATYPLEIVEASRWSKENPDLQGDEAVLAVENFNWDISIKTLVAFPDLIQLMDENLAWTRQLGDAFLMQEAQVMDTVQQLRQRSLDAGSLASLEHVRVEQEEEVIIIEPADIRVVYVPYYRPTIVYGDWWWYDYPPYYWDPPRRYYSGVGFHWSHGFHWSVGFRISTRFYYSFCDWHHRSIHVHHHHHYDRHDWDRIRIRPRHSSNSQVWKHNPHHRRGVDYRSDRLNIEHPRHSSSGKTTKPIMARPSRNPDDTQNNILASNRPDPRRGSTQAGSVGTGNVRPERPGTPGKGGMSEGTIPSTRVAPSSKGATVAAKRSARVSPSARSAATTRSAPVARSSSSQATRSAPKARTSSSNSSSRPSSVTRSSSSSRPSNVTRSSSSSRPSSVTRTSPSSRSSSVNRSSSSSRPSSVSRSSSSSSTRSAPQARSSSSSRSTPSARAPSSSRSSGSSSRTSSSSGGSYSRPSAPARSSGSSSSNSRYSGGDDGGFRKG